VDERLGFLQADVAAARDLSERQHKELTAKLEQLTGKRILLRFKLDASLIGGVVAHIGSTVYDGSVRGRLASMERRLTAEN
jgi:F-type H+-transporting ATPase subunit delta